MSQEIRKLLEQRYQPGEYILMQEVSDASGFSRSRSLDWMVAAIWESRGLSITGIEQKSFRGDWLKELKDPKKQENHFKFCDYFYLFTTNDNVAKLEEIPDTWGWIQVQGSRIKEIKKAPKLSPIPATRSFMIAMLRRAASKNGFIHESDIESRIEVIVEQKVNQIVRGDHAAKKYKELLDKVNKFKEESGVDIEFGWFNYYKETGPSDVGKAVRFLLDNGMVGVKNRMNSLKESHQRIIDTIDKEAKQLKL